MSVKLGRFNLSRFFYRSPRLLPAYLCEMIGDELFPLAIFSKYFETLCSRRIVSGNLLYHYIMYVL